MTTTPNLLDGTWYAGQPFDDWAWMRRESPVHWDEQGQVWGLARHEDVLAVEKDPTRFSSKRAPRPHGDPLPMMISMDDPDHQRRRSLVNRGFTPRRIGELEDKVAELSRRIVDRVAASGSCDAVWDLAARLPLLVIADLLGFQEEHYDDLLRWSDDMMLATDLDPSPELADGGLRAMLGFRELQLGVIEDRRANPRDDLISVLCAAEVDGHRLDDESIVQETLLLLIGGDETTRHVITGGLLALMAHPDAAGVAGRGPRPTPGRGGGAAALGLADQEHGPHGDRGPGAAGPAAARGRPGDPPVPVGEPGRGRVRPARRRWIWAGTPTPTWPSASGPTSASAPRWPAWSCGSCSGRC